MIRHPRRTQLALGAMLILGLALGLAGCGGKAVHPPNNGPYSALDTSSAVLDRAMAIGMINAYRKGKGLAALQEDAALDAAADAMAEKAGREDRSTFGEVPNLIGGIAPNGATIRLSAGYRTFADAFSGWRGVPAHDAALLAKDAKSIGLAARYAPTGKYRVYWALAIGRP